MRRSSGCWTTPTPPKLSNTRPSSRCWSRPPTDPKTIHGVAARLVGSSPPVPEVRTESRGRSHRPMSDHFSGPRAIAGPAGDICDVYAFPSPQRPGHLVLVMTVRPLAGPDSSFSDAIVCRFRLRPLENDEDGRSFAFGPEESELVFACTFEAPQPGVDGARPVQDGYCIAPSGETARFRVDDEGGGRLDGLRVYAGLHSDPFFIDLPAYLESLKTGRLAFKQEGQNILADTNVLGVVVEADCEPLLQSSSAPLLAVVGETVVAGKLPIRIERFGRPEIKNVIMSM